MRGRSVGRRLGLLAGVSALTGALVDRVTSRPVSAVDGDKVVLGIANSGTATTELSATLSGTGEALRVVSAVSSPATHVVNGVRTSDRLTKDLSHALGLVGGAIDKPNGNAVAGTGLVANGGSGSNGAVGLVAVGGAATSTPVPGNMYPIAGSGAVVQSGADKAGGKLVGVGARFSGGISGGYTAGTGLLALGGSGKTAPDGIGVAGLAAHGGDADEDAPVAGDGLIASGKGARTGVGLLAFRSARREGNHSDVASAIEAFGGEPKWDGATEGSGVLGYGGLNKDDVRPGIHGIHHGDGEAVGLRATTNSKLDVAATYGALHAESYAGTAALFESTEGTAMDVFAGIGGIQLVNNGGSPATEAVLATGGSGAIMYADKGVGCIGSAQQHVGGWFQTGSATQPALWATNPAGSGMIVTGSLVVQHGVKSVAVPTSQGMRRLFCLEATVALFEDLGTTRLVNGRVRVDLEPRFLETIDPQGYHVFLSPLGETEGVYVTDQGATGFEIRARRATATLVDVAYRIVARRKGIPDAHRLATFTPPNATAPVARPPRSVPRPPAVPAIQRPMAPPPTPTPPPELRAGLA